MKHKITLAVLFFLMVISPAIYFCFIPITFIAETHEFYAPDIKSYATTQDVVFNTSVKYNHNVFLTRELNLIEADSRKVVYTMDKNLRDIKQDAVVKVVYDLPSNLAEGQYYWSVGITRQLPYFIKRIQTIESNIFEVTA